jgi:drug/metabolite transporter (DMT)-like permease
MKKLQPETIDRNKQADYRGNGNAWRQGLMADRLAPFAFVLLWSSSFVATRAGLRYVSPLAFVTLRVGLCALALLAVMVGSRRRWAPLAGKWQHCAVAGGLINGVMLAASHWGVARAGAAPLALVQTLNPLLTALLGGPLLGEWLRLRQWLGLALGAAGVALVVGMAATSDATQFDGLAVGAGGVLALIAGTLYYARFCRDVPLLPGTTVQFLSASVVCAAATLIFETPHATWTGTALAALLWNAGPVSFGGMALYFLMLTHGTAARTTANFCLVPGVTALMAWSLIGESLTFFAIAGLVTASIGCFLVSVPHRVERRRFGRVPAPYLLSHRAVRGAERSSEAAREQPAPSGGQLRDA